MDLQVDTRDIYAIHPCKCRQAVRYEGPTNRTDTSPDQYIGSLDSIAVPLESKCAFVESYDTVSGIEKPLQERPCDNRALIVPIRKGTIRAQGP